MRVVLKKNNVTISREEKDVAPLLADGWVKVEPKKEVKPKRTPKKEDK